MADDSVFDKVKARVGGYSSVVDEEGLTEGIAELLGYYDLLDADAGNGGAKVKDQMDDAAQILYDQARAYAKLIVNYCDNRYSPK